MDKTKVYKTEKKKNVKRAKLIKRILLILLAVIIIGAGIAFGMVFNIVKDAKLSMQDLVLKYENSVVKDLDGNTIAVLSGDENNSGDSVGNKTIKVAGEDVIIDVDEDSPW